MVAPARTVIDDGENRRPAKWIVALAGAAPPWAPPAPAVASDVLPADGPAPPDAVTTIVPWYGVASRSRSSTYG